MIKNPIAWLSCPSRPVEHFQLFVSLRLLPCFQAKKEICDVKSQRLSLAQDEYKHLNSTLTNLATSHTSRKSGVLRCYHIPQFISFDLVSDNGVPLLLICLTWLSSDDNFILSSRSMFKFEQLKYQIRSGLAQGRRVARKKQGFTIKAGARTNQERSQVQRARVRETSLVSTVVIRPIKAMPSCGLKMFSSDPRNACREEMGCIQSQSLAAEIHATEACMEIRRVFG